MKKVNGPDKICLVLKTCTIAELEHYRDELNKLISAKSEELIAQKNKTERLKIFLKQNDMDGSVLFADKVFNRQPKYAFFDSTGELHTWAGTGHVPTVLQSLLDNGAQLEDFAIEKMNLDDKK